MNRSEGVGIISADVGSGRRAGKMATPVDYHNIDRLLLLNSIPTEASRVFDENNIVISIFTDTRFLNADCKSVSLIQTTNSGRNGGMWMTPNDSARN